MKQFYVEKRQKNAQVLILFPYTQKVQTKEKHISKTKLNMDDIQEICVDCTHATVTHIYIISTYTYYINY